MATEAKNRQALKPRPRRAKKRPANRVAKAPASNPLPAPLPVGVVEVEQEQPNQRGGLFGMFQSSNPEAEAATVADSSGGSSDGSTASYDEDVTRLLDSVPDVIGEQEQEQAGAAAVPGASAGMRAGLGMLGGEIVSAETLAGILQSSFGWLAELRKRDCYKLDAGKAGTLAGVWHPVVNDWWQKFAPQFLAQWSMANPGLFSALLTTAVVVGPMLGADLKQSAADRARARVLVHPGASHVAASPAAAPAPSNGAVWFHEAGEAA